MEVVNYERILSVSMRKLGPEQQSNSQKAGISLQKTVLVCNLMKKARNMKEQLEYSTAFDPNTGTQSNVSAGSWGTTPNTGPAFGQPLSSQLENSVPSDLPTLDFIPLVDTFNESSLGGPNRPEAPEIGSTPGADLPRDGGSADDFDGFFNLDVHPIPGSTELVQSSVWALPIPDPTGLILPSTADATQQHTCHPPASSTGLLVSNSSGEADDDQPPHKRARPGTDSEVNNLCQLQFEQVRDDGAHLDVSSSLDPVCCLAPLSPDSFSKLLGSLRQDDDGTGVAGGGSTLDGLQGCFDNLDFSGVRTCAEDWIDPLTPSLFPVECR
jgi:hypothetical protein